MNKELLIALFFLITSSLLTVIDVIADLSEGTSIQHVTLEVGVIVIGIAGSLLIIRRLVFRLRSEIKRNQEDIEALRSQSAKWKTEAQSLLKGLAIQIDHQFTAWGFTAAEKEVALLLIKGLSSKEIAKVRKTQEKTVRLQSSAVYKKSGVSGRAELAAFFLEDLLLPQSVNS